MQPAEIRRLRRRTGFSQTRFAALLGVSFVTVNRWEGGQAVPDAMHVALLELLAAALGRHDGPVVERALRAVEPTHVARIRALVALGPVAATAGAGAGTVDAAAEEGRTR